MAAAAAHRSLLEARWQTFRRGRVLENLAGWPRRILEDTLLTRFIWSRGFLRGLAHFLFMWGCILAVLITFPLVFGWIYFDSSAEDLEAYRVVIFRFPTFSFSVGSTAAFFLFHGLVWSSFRVIAGSCSRYGDGGAGKGRRRYRCSIWTSSPWCCSLPSASPD